MLEHGGSEERLEISALLKGQIIALSLHTYGCRVVQKALQVLPEEKQVEIVAELESQVRLGDIYGRCHGLV